MTVALFSAFAAASAGVDRSATVRAPKRSSSAHGDRAQARMIKLKLIEQEQEIEDREAVNMIKVRCFIQMHTLSCTHVAYRGRQYRPPRILLVRQGGILGP